MTRIFEPLYINGKRDKARRYINTETGETISRRQYIKLTEGVSPEEKAIKRYLEAPEQYKTMPKTMDKHMAYLPIKWRYSKMVSYRDRGKYKRYWQLQINALVMCDCKQMEEPVLVEVYGYSRVYELRNFDKMLDEAKAKAEAEAISIFNTKYGIPERSGLCKVRTVQSAKWLRVVDSRNRV